MMVNVSRFNDVQERVYGLIYDYLEKLKSSISVNARLDPRQANDALWKELERDFEAEYSNYGYEFRKVRDVLPEAVRSIRPVTINMRGGTLDYSKHKETGLHVIAIGGLSLSRGLTLEGLSVSYILRNTATSDTLMQMARWFGYRPGYEDVCRLYLPQSSYDYYEFVNESVEELREEVKRMEQLNLTPSDFGLKVRQSPAALEITAANKMRSARQVTLSEDYSGRHLEGYAVCNDQSVNLANLSLLYDFLRSLRPSSDAVTGASEGPCFFWKAIEAREVHKLVSSFRFGPNEHLSPIQGTTSLFLDYFTERMALELRTWDVVLPYLSDVSSGDPLGEVVLGNTIVLRERTSGELSGDSYETFKVTGNKNRVADPADARRLLDPSIVERILEESQRRRENGERGLGDRGFCMVRERPLLLVHLFRTKGKTKHSDQRDRLQLKDPVVSLSFCLPKSSLEPISRTYQVNVTYRRQMESLASEPEDDEASLEAATDG